MDTFIGKRKGGWGGRERETVREGEREKETG